MKRGSTLFLKTVIAGMGIATLAICIFLLPMIAKGLPMEFPEIAYLKFPFLIGMYLSAIPFFVALYEAFKLLSYIDKNNAFSILSIKALRRIKYCGAVMSVLYAATLMPLLYHVADFDDAPGLVAIGMIFTCAPVVIAVFAAVLERLLRNAIDIKTENDLVV